MNFGQAVNSSLINKYSTFKGRACRAEWWYFLLFSFLVSLLASTVTVFFTFGSVDWEYVATLSEDNATTFILNSDFGTSIRVVSIILALALFLPGFAVTVRRLQADPPGHVYAELLPVDERMMASWYWPGFLRTRQLRCRYRRSLAISPISARR